MIDNAINQNNPLRTLVFSGLVDDSVNERERRFFNHRFREELAREDVIFGEKLSSFADFEQQLKDNEEKVDSLVLSTHGNAGEVPTMWFPDVGAVRIDDIIKLANKYNKNTLKKIHLTSCHIGFNFEEIEEQNTSSVYYQGLTESMQMGQALYLHGDERTGDTFNSLGKRLKGVVENKDYSVGVAIIDSREGLRVVAKINESDLQSFSHHTFVRQSEDISVAALRDYLAVQIEKAEQFSDASHIVKNSAAQEKLDKISDNDLESHLRESFVREAIKELDNPEYFENIQSLLKKKGVDVNWQGEMGETILVEAVKRHRLDVTELLLDREDIDVDIETKVRTSAIWEAVKSGNNQAVQMLLDKKKVDEKMGREIYKSVDWAIRCNEFGIVENFLEHKDKLAMSEKDIDSLFAVSFPIEGNKEALKLVEVPLRQNLDQEAIDNNGWILMNDVSTKMILLEDGVDLNALDKRHQNPEVTEASDKRLSIMTLLLRHGAKPAALDNWKMTALEYSVKYGHVETLQNFLKDGADPDYHYPSKHGRSPLTLAASNGNLKMLELLLEYGANPNIFAGKESTPLMFAAEYYQVEAVRFLLDKEADPTLIGRKGRGVLDSLVLSRSLSNGQDVEIAKMFSQDGRVDFNQNNKGPEILKKARNRGQEDLAKFISEEMEVQEKRKEDSFMKDVLGGKGDVATVASLNEEGFPQLFSPEVSPETSPETSQGVTKFALDPKDIQLEFDSMKGLCEDKQGSHYARDASELTKYGYGELAAILIAASVVLSFVFRPGANPRPAKESNSLAPVVEKESRSAP